MRERTVKWAKQFFILKQKKQCPQFHLEKPVKTIDTDASDTAQKRQNKNKPLLHLKPMKILFCTENINYGMKPFQTLWEHKSKDQSFQLV